MNGEKWFKLSAMAALVLVALAGCAHVVSSAMREKARPDLTFSTVLGNPDAYKGETVIWGGVIIGVINRENDTLIKVLETTLDSYGMPMERESSKGRFIALVKGYADEEVYRKGYMLTVAGEVAGKESLPVGESQYVYPVMLAKEVHVWAYYPYPYPYAFPYMPYGYPYYWGYDYAYPYW